MPKKGPKKPPSARVLARRRQVGDQIREARRDRQWTQERLAEGAELDRVTIVRIETAVWPVKLDHLQMIADALGVPLSHLVRE